MITQVHIHQLHFYCQDHPGRVIIHIYICKLFPLEIWEEEDEEIMEPFCQLEDNKDCFLCVSSRRFAKPVGFLSHDHFMIPKANIATSCKKSKRRCWPSCQYMYYMYILYIHILLCTSKSYQAFHYFHPTKSHFKLWMRELRRRRITTQKCHLETEQAKSVQFII